MKQRPDPSEVRPGPGPLFDPPTTHLSGRTDPVTSREAAARMVVSGRLTRDQGRALHAIRAHPGLTAKELGYAEAARLSFEDKSGTGMVADAEACRQRIGRRLNELEKAGLIRREGERDGCSVWWPVEGR